MNKFLSTLLFLCISTLIAWAQPQPCGPNPVMTPLCEDACVICDIDGFTGVNDNQATGIAPDDFCTTFVHHVTWIAFVAGSEDLTLEVTISGCSIGWGLEIGIYESLGCDLSDMVQVSNCDTDAANNAVTTFTNSVPLTIGQYYYFVMDGSGGDVCNYTVNVTNGTTEIGALEPITGIDGPSLVCPDAPQIFTVPEIPGATLFQWTVNGGTVSTTPEELEYTFNNTGAYNICYSAFNVCDTLAPVCTIVTVEEIPPVTFNEEICTGDTLFVLDTFFVDAGFYNYEFIDADNCLQQVIGNLEVDVPESSDLELEFCFGDTVFLNNQPYTETGSYDVVFDTPAACDSTVFLEITTFLCDIDGGFADDNLLCQGDQDGQLVFNLLDGNFPYTFEWEEETGTNLTGSGTSDINSTTITIPDLLAGIYSITITDASGSVGIFVGQVFEPNPLVADFTYSMYDMYNVSCPDASDGSVALEPTGGTAPYTFLWQSGNQTNFEENLAAGTYMVTVTDSNGCPVVILPELIPPPPVTATFDLIQPGCNPDDSGIIQVASTDGGTGPFTFSFEGGDFSGSSSFNNLFPGTYSVAVQDMFGCEYEEKLDLLEPNTLVLDLGEDLEMCLGDSIRLKPSANEFDLTYIWSPDVGLSCTDCPQPYARPFSDITYHLTAIMPNGCERSDSMSISVVYFHNTYFPNVFSPNDDGINDIFRVFPTKEVAQVIDFRVFNRWGGQVAGFQNYSPFDTNIGWDGTFNGELANPGVYVWFAQVQFLDGAILEFEGDVTLVR